MIKKLLALLLALCLMTGGLTLVALAADGEPMKLRDGEEVGFGDNYYYQMTGYIRQYKGTGRSQRPRGSSPLICPTAPRGTA